MDRPVTGGHLLAAISNAIVSIMRERYGRGPMQAKTYVLDDLILVVLRGSGFSEYEQTMMDADAGGRQRVVEMRGDFHRMMAPRYRATIEDLSGRKVLALLSQSHVDPEITVEVFVMDRPLPGCGGLDVAERA